MKWISIEEYEDEWAGEWERLLSEWPPERVKSTILAIVRRRCKYALKKIAELEIENRDARVRGVSYAKRKEITQRIERLKVFFAQDREYGLNASKRTFSALDFIEPNMRGVVHSEDFEERLRLATIQI